MGFEESIVREINEYLGPLDPGRKKAVLGMVKGLYWQKFGKRKYGAVTKRKNKSSIGSARNYGPTLYDLKNWKVTREQIGDFVIETFE